MPALPAVIFYSVCRGGCPFIPDKYLEYHCREKYHTSLAIFGLALHMLTGDVLTEVRPAG
ncbi:MAG: hypothetical protein LBQ10_11550 [Desulfovibrio sp.]|nr:hypothetical protein [Desulfovibrio sp.]